MNYNQSFIKEYDKVACPLYDHISGDNTAHKKKQIQWTEECQDAFHMLKVMCTSAQFLAFTDFMKPFKLHISLGAVLYWKEGRKDQVIGYTS